MADIPEKDLEETRAALAPTLQKIASILPWLSKPKELRFDPELNERWIAACKNLSAAWLDRFSAGEAAIRPAIFALYSLALESKDPDSLRLGEALASAADHLEDMTPTPRLIAALTATIESLLDKEGLEHPTFSERAQHFSQRLDAVNAPGGLAPGRSVTLDKIFAAEAGERLERMQDAFALLPPDGYALKSEAVELAQEAQAAELFGIMHLARQLAEATNTRASELDNDAVRQLIESRLKQLAEMIATVHG